MTINILLHKYEQRQSNEILHFHLKKYKTAAPFSFKILNLKSILKFKKNIKVGIFFQSVANSVRDFIWARICANKMQIIYKKELH